MTGRPVRPDRPRRARKFAQASNPLTGFNDTSVWTGLTLPTALRFASDGRVFVAEKSGIIKVFDSITDTTPTVFADLRTDVDDYWDRGLLGMTLDPAFPASPYVYALYARDAIPAGARRAGMTPAPPSPGPNTDGCLVSGRLVRLTMSGGVATTQKMLIDDWCQQFPSHSVGDLRFGADGALYVTGGDGASFNDVDYGQIRRHDRRRPTCRRTRAATRRPAPVAPNRPPTARGGALRSQSIRRPTGEPVVLDGALLRVDPATGARSRTTLASRARTSTRDASSPTASATPSGSRSVRGRARPGSATSAGPTGRRSTASSTRCRPRRERWLAVLRGQWPAVRLPGRANLALCSSLYTTPTGLLTPYYTYSHGSQVVNGEVCQSGSSSISGITFYQGGNYPASYTNGMFFADHSRNCIWFMRAGGNGLPDKTQISTFISAASNPVDLETGPNGDLFYVDFEGGNDPSHHLRLGQPGADGA